MSSLLAYLDPGSGSLFLQGAVAVAATLMMGISGFSDHIKSFFRKVFKRDGKCGK